MGSDSAEEMSSIASAKEFVGRVAVGRKTCHFCHFCRAFRTQLRRKIFRGISPFAPPQVGFCRFCRQVSCYFHLCVIGHVVKFDTHLSGGFLYLVPRGIRKDVSEMSSLLKGRLTTKQMWIG